MDKDRKSAEYSFGRALVYWDLDQLHRAGKSEKALEAYAQAVKLKGDYPEALLSWGRYLLANATTVNGVTLPSFNIRRPYSEADELKSSWVGERKIELDRDMLELATQKLSESVRQTGDPGPARFHLGLARALGTAATNSPEIHHRIQGLQDAVSHLQTALIYLPFHAPCYLYSGLLQFLLSDLAERSETAAINVVEIRRRRAFYQLEHLIDLELERIVDDSGNVPRKPFYFDPEHIGDLLKRRYDFIMTLETRLALPSLTGCLRDGLTVAEGRRPSYQDDFVETLKRYLARLRSAASGAPS